MSRRRWAPCCRWACRGWCRRGFPGARRRSPSAGSDRRGRRPALSPPDAARAAVCAELDAIDAALDRIRETSTELVGSAFRVQVATRLEHQDRVNRGLSYRMLGELFDPPDGREDPELPTGHGLRDRLSQGLRITRAEVRRRVKFAARIRARRGGRSRRSRCGSAPVRHPASSSAPPSAAIRGQPERIRIAAARFSFNGAAPCCRR